MADNARLLAFIAQCDDIKKLKSLIKNARDQGAAEIERAAFRKLISIVPSEQPGTASLLFSERVCSAGYASIYGAREQPLSKAGVTESGIRQRSRIQKFIW